VNILHQFPIPKWFFSFCKRMNNFWKIQLFDVWSGMVKSGYSIETLDFKSCIQFFLKQKVCQHCHYFLKYLSALCLLGASAVFQDNRNMHFPLKWWNKTVLNHPLLKLDGFKTF
jgi:hypothetical protein